MLSYRPTLRSFATLQDDRKGVTPVLNFKICSFVFV